MAIDQFAGMQSGRAAVPREILRSTDYKLEIAGVLDATNSIDGSNTGFTNTIRGGWLLGQITSSKKWVPLKRSLASATTTAGNTVTVTTAAAFRVGDAIDIGATTNRTITAINYGTNVITFNGAAINVALLDVVAARDGSQNCRGVLINDEVELLDYENRVATDKPARILIAGFVFNSRLLGDVAAAATDTSSVLTGRILRDSEYGF